MSDEFLELSLAKTLPTIVDSKNGHILAWALKETLHSNEEDTCNKYTLTNLKNITLSHKSASKEEVDEFSDLHQGRK